MSEKYQDLLIVENKRVFIDVAYRGCGSGCKYCYVTSASEEQLLASSEDLMKVVYYLCANHMLGDRIVSFCTNTKPFKTRESAERILFVIRQIKEFRQKNI